MSALHSTPVCQATRPVPSPLDRALAAGNWPAMRPDGIWVVESNSMPGMDRRVKILPDGVMTCSCPAGLNNVPDCRHRAAVRYCIEHNIRARFLLCTRCQSMRVAKPGLCVECQAVVAEQAAPKPATRRRAVAQVAPSYQPLPVSAYPARRAVCLVCGEKDPDPLHDAYCG